MASYIGQILDQALELNLERQMVMQSYRQTYSTLQWLMEFGTVSMNLGRATGKTTAIMRRACSQDLVVVHDYASLKRMEAESVFNPLVATYNELEYPANKLRGRSFQRIWVDNAVCLGRPDVIVNVFDAALLTSVKQIILLG